LLSTTFFHIWGGLRGIDLDATGNLKNSLFSFKLSYEEGTNGYFDGNIRNQYWKSNIDGVQRAYEYSYDKASRIISGAYGSTKAGENYALNGVTYDLNGNITTLSRNGYKSNNTFGLVDNLGYSYQTNSNKIQSVSDNSGETASFTDATGATDYTYSLDGSLTSDANKGISLIEYNYLKLPKRIVQNGVTTLIQYDAMGKKLKETIGTQVTDYVGNKIYKANILYQIAHDEGRIIGGEYEYHIKDHLGNLRVAFRDSSGIAKITQSNAYGCWGENLPTLGYLKSTWSKDFFKFTGKEELQGTGYIDFGARLYDPLVPHFTTIDPLSELSRRFSPFTYANNNPLRFIDPDGMMATETVGADGLTNDQWLSAGGDFGREKEYRQENDDKDKKKKKEETKKILPTVAQVTSNGLNPNGDGISPDYTIESILIGERVFKPLESVFGKILGKLFGTSSKFGTLQYASKFGIQEADILRQAVINQLGRGSGLQVHHLLEQRFAQILGQNADDMLSIVVTRAEHDVFTAGWRTQIGLNGWVNSIVTTSTASRQIIENAAKIIYKDYPEILKALKL
jgi:RHS repeat-associated protein